MPEYCKPNKWTGRKSTTKKRKRFAKRNEIRKFFLFKTKLKSTLLNRTLFWNWYRSRRCHRCGCCIVCSAHFEYFAFVWGWRHTFAASLSTLAAFIPNTPQVWGSAPSCSKGNDGVDGDGAVMRLLRPTMHIRRKNSVSIRIMMLDSALQQTKITHLLSYNHNPRQNECFYI